MKAIRSIAILALLTLPAAAWPKDAAPGDNARYQRVIVHGKSLEGNLSGDSPDRQVSVYLPPDYAKATRQRFPVVDGDIVVPEEPGLGVTLDEEVVARFVQYAMQQFGSK